jgi:signal transduction histidine kinase
MALSLEIVDSRTHLVQFYEDERTLKKAVSEFFASGAPAIVIATPEHRAEFRRMCRGDVVMLDARETLATFMVGGMPDRNRFEEVVGRLLDEMIAKHPAEVVYAYGEMVDLLWRDGNQRAALQLEELWNEAGARRRFHLLCAYAMGNFYTSDGTRGFDAVCHAHTHVLPLDDSRVRMLERELVERKELEIALRDARAETETLYRIHRVLHEDLSVETVVQRLTDQATAVCRAQFGAFFYNLVDDRGESYTLYTLAGVPREKFAGFPMPRNTEIFGPTFRGEGVVRLDDVTRDPRYGKNAPYHGMPPGHPPVRSHLAVPVIAVGGEVLGGLFFAHAEPGVFTAADERLVVAIAGQAATAIHNARLFEGERGARRHAETSQQRTELLQSITAALARPLGADEAARIVVKELRKLLGADAGAVLLVDEAGERIETLLIDGDYEPQSAAEVQQMPLATDIPICAAARTGTIRWAVGRAAIARHAPDMIPVRGGKPIKTWGAVPLMFEGRTIGALGFRCANERDLTADEAALLLAVARQCAAAIERARLFEAAQAARAEAESANRAKDEFLAMLGHELRNPLSPILTAVQLMRMRGDQSSLKEQNIIERQVKHLIHLVDDLLDVTRIERGKVDLEPRPVLMSTILARALEIAAPLIEERRHDLRVETSEHELWVNADEVRMCQVVTNLLTNAAKYTDPGGTIEVTTRRDGSDVVLAVRDNGVGMPPELLPRVFDLFVQGERTADRRQGGLGLGLSLVKNIVAMHGGSVSAHSAGARHGSEFVVRLPLLVTPARTEVPDAERAGVEVVRRRVMVVDDNEDAAALLADMLRSVGHDVLVAHDGADALARSQPFAPDVAVLDLGLPGMDGYQLARALGERFPSVRVMALTGYGRERDREGTKAAGFEAHFTKPVAFGKLLAAIEITR